MAEFERNGFETKKFSVMSKRIVVRHQFSVMTASDAVDGSHHRHRDVPDCGVI
jgi:hypothetical protein